MATPDAECSGARLQRDPTAPCHRPRVVQDSLEVESDSVLDEYQSFPTWLHTDPIQVLGLPAQVSQQAQAFGLTDDIISARAFQQARKGYHWIVKALSNIRGRPGVPDCRPCAP